MILVPDSWGSGLMEDNDCHEPAGSPKGGQFCGRRESLPDVLSADSIARSLDYARQVDDAQKKERAGVLDALPDGTAIALGRGRGKRTYVKQKVAGDTFWITEDPRAQWREEKRPSFPESYSSHEFATELGVRLDDYRRKS